MRLTKGAASLGCKGLSPYPPPAAVARKALTLFPSEGKEDANPILLQPRGGL